MSAAVKPSTVKTLSSILVTCEVKSLTEGKATLPPTISKVVSVTVSPVTNPCPLFVNLPSSASQVTPVSIPPVGKAKYN